MLPYLNPEESVAYGRLDLDDGDTLYIGKAPISDAAKQRLVISWKAPAAAAYNRATIADPQGVRRKREFTANRNIIKNFHDSVFAELAQDVANLGGDIQLDDSILSAMGQTRSGTMQEIVKTIQAAQDKIMRSDRNQLLIVQGGPGTGKTAVALHRVSWLLYNHDEDLQPQDVLVIGPSRTFTSYIREVLPSLGDRNVVQQSLQDLLAPDIQIAGVDPDDVAAVKGSSRMADVIAEGLNDRIRPPKEPVRIRRRNSGRYISLTAEEVTGELGKIRSEFHAEGRAALRGSLIELCSLQLDLLHGASALDLLDLPSLDAEVEKIWPRFSPHQFISDLLGSRDRLRRACRNLLTDAETEKLYRRPAGKIGEEPWTMADLALIDEAAEQMRGEGELFGHIVVDEAQDLSEMQLMAIRRRSRTGSMTVVGDIAQSTGAFARDSWADVKTLLGFAKVPAQVVELEHGYRVPKEVFEVARPVLEVAAPGITPPKVVRSVGAAPGFTRAPLSELPFEVASIARRHRDEERFVGVIAVENHWEDLGVAFELEGLPLNRPASGTLTSAINLVTPEGSKGLEFDTVIIVDPQSVLEQKHGGRLLYIALTRTTSRLEVLCPGEIPDLLTVTGLPGTNIADASKTLPTTTAAAVPTPVTIPKAVKAAKPKTAEPAAAPPESPRAEQKVTAPGHVEIPAPASVSLLNAKIAESTARHLADALQESVQPMLYPLVLAELARILKDD